MQDLRRSSNYAFLKLNYLNDHVLITFTFILLKVVAITSSSSRSIKIKFKFFPHFFFVTATIMYIRLSNAYYNRNNHFNFFILSFSLKKKFSNHSHYLGIIVNSFLFLLQLQHKIKFINNMWKYSQYNINK